MTIPDIANGVAANDSTAIDELYRLIKTKVCRDPWRDEDVLHDLFIQVLSDLRNGRLNHPEALLGYARRQFGRMMFRHVQSAQKMPRSVLTDEIPSEFSLGERNALRLLIRRNHARYREVLYRTFFLEQDVEEIRLAMGFQNCACVHTIRSLALARLRGIILAKDRRRKLTRRSS